MDDDRLSLEGIFACKVLLFNNSCSLRHSQVSFISFTKGTISGFQYLLCCVIFFFYDNLHNILCILFIYASYKKKIS